MRTLWNTKRFKNQEDLIMRVKFGDHVDLCKRVSYSGGSMLIITTVYNAVYTVECRDKAVAARLYENVLEYGFINVSEFEYTN